MAYIGSHLKSMNRKLVFQLLLSKGSLSKAEISRITGISAPTVIKIIDHFKSIGLVEELGEGNAILGRKPLMLQINRQAGYAIGIEYTGMKIKLGMVDMGGNICCLQTEKTISDFNKVIRYELREKIDSLLKKSGVPVEKVLGICIGLPGRVNTAQETIELAPLEGITERTSYCDITNDLKARYKIPVIIENDANAATIGEFNCRGLSPDEDLLYISFGKGIGAGILLNGLLRKGRNFLAGEIGYMVLDKQYSANRQSAGWLEGVLTPERLSDLQETVSPEYIAHFIDHLALAILNICVPLEIHNIVLGHIREDHFDKEFVQKVNTLLGKLSVIDLKCELPLCGEPVIAGCANIVMEPVLNKILGE